MKKVLDGYFDSDYVYLIQKDIVGKYEEKIPFDWYFYSDYSFIEYILKNSSVDSFKKAFNISKIIVKKPYCQIFIPYENSKSLISTIERYGFKTYEGEVDPIKRYIIDSEDCQISDEYKILYFDIETDDRPNADNSTDIIVGSKSILSISGYCSETDYFTICEDSEIEVLRKALEKFKEYDIIVGWNSKSFDLPYIINRLNFYKSKGLDIVKEVKFDWHRIIHVDLMWRFKHVYQHNSVLTSFSLKRVSEYFKVGAKLDLNNRKIYDLFINDRELLMKYNLQDCRLLYELESKLGIIQHMISMAIFCKTFLSDFYITELLNNISLIYSNKYNIRLETKKFINEKKEEYVGGYVLDPVSGLHRNVYIFDFQSLYPNIIRTWNVSPDTLLNESNGDCIKSCLDGVFFKKDKMGLLPSIETYLLNLRNEYKEKKKALKKEGKENSVDYSVADRNEKIIKELANSVYGATANNRSRFFDLRLAESITLAGQTLIKFAKKFFTDLGFVVVSGDTDSIMVSLKDGSDYKFLLDKFHAELDKFLFSTYNTLNPTTRFKYEKRFDKFIVIKKKNYVGRVIDDGSPCDTIYAKGLELIKKDTIKYTRERLSELIKNLLYTDNPLDFYVKYIEDEWEKINTINVNPEDIVITKKISKDFSEYKSLPMQVKIAKKVWNSNNKDFFIGMDFQYVIKDSLDKENKAIWVGEFDGKFDRNYYWEHLIYPPFRRILEVVFPSYQWDKYEHGKYWIKPSRSRKKALKKS